MPKWYTISNAWWKNRLQLFTYFFSGIAFVRPIFVDFQWVLDADHPRIYPCLPVFARKRNVSFLSLNVAKSGMRKRVSKLRRDREVKGFAEGKVSLYFIFLNYKPSATSSRLQCIYMYRVSQSLSNSPYVLFISLSPSLMRLLEFVFNLLIYISIWHQYRFIQFPSLVIIFNFIHLYIICLLYIYLEYSMK